MTDDNTTGAPATQPLGAVSTSRVEAFSDGVFAIATTLLILEIAVPHVGEKGDLFRALFDLWPSYVSYAVSFVTIGLMWINHHYLIGLFARVDRPLLFLNLGLLAVIAFIPFPTGVLAEYLVDGDQQQLFAAATLYGVTMIGVSGFFLLLWMHVRRATGSLKNPAAAVPAAGRAIVFCLCALAAYLIAIAVGALAPVVSLVLFAAVASLFALGRYSR
ncbi:TMEM175 family protein [Subtercola endophyticus]|uniref:TMEM175 family protein n=1 Tax=Subtercola endophyticus TaxID=2895559 RepID=UPI001E4CCADA|nr:TMEM175 family protein [Subtercola endophyticus]UFS59381.1 DUF1211 domain-containing protein [Subtercola endophyticus]